MALSGSSGHRWALLAIFLLALGLRVGFVLTQPNTVTWPDAQDHDAIARNIIHGNGFVETAGQRASRAPVYPIFLAACYAVGLDSPRHIHIIQALAGAAACLLATLLGRRFYGMRAGIIAGIFAAIYPFFIFYTATLLTETLFITGVTGFIILLAFMLESAPESFRKFFIWALLAGATAGVLVLLKSSFLLYPLALLPLFILIVRPIRRAFIGWGIVMVVMITIMSPWIIRNYVLFKHFIPTTLQAGPSLYEANSPYADGGPAMDRIDWVAERGNQPMGEYENNKFFTRAALEYMRANPQRTFRLSIEKARRFWNPLPNYTPYRTPLYVLGAIGSYVPIMILAISGILFYRKKGWQLLLLLSPVAYFAALHMVFVGSTRYRTPIMVFLIIFAGAGADILIKRWQQRRQRPHSRGRRIKKILLVVFAVIFVVILTGIGLWRRYLNDERIRQIARAHLQEMVGSEVFIGGATVRLPRGVILRDVRIQDASNSNGLPVAQVGTVLIAPSWSELLKGRMLWRNLELENLHLNAEFDENGRWQFLDQIDMTKQSDGPAPTIFITEASVRVTGLQNRAGLPPVEISRINATFRAANPEASLYNVVIWSEDRMRGRPRVTATFDPKTQQATGRFSLFGLNLDQRMHDSVPDKVRVLWDDLSPTGRAALDISGEFVWDSHSPNPFDITGRTALRVDGLRPRRFPYPIEAFRAEADFNRSDLSIRAFQGRAGKAEFSGSGRGVFTLSGAFHGGVTLRAKGLALDDTLYKALPEAVRAQWNKIKPGGTVDALVFLNLDQGGDTPDVRAEGVLRDCSSVIPGLPFPVTKVNGTVRLHDGRLTLRKIQGQIGESEFQTEDGFVSLDPKGPFRIGVTARQIAINHSLSELVPKSVSDRIRAGTEFLGKDAVLTCRMDIAAHASRARIGAPLKIRGDIGIWDAAYVHPRLAEPVQTEALNLHFTQDELVLDGLNAQWRDSTITMPKTGFTFSPDGVSLVDLVLANMTMDKVLHDLMPLKCQAAWDTFAPTGKMSMSIAVRRKAGRDESLHTTIRADFKDATVEYKGFPYPAHDVSGRLTFEDMKLIRGDFRGLHGESSITVALVRKNFHGAPGLNLLVETPSIPIDDALRDALPPRYQSLWDTIKPDGTLGLELDCHWPLKKSAPLPYEWKATARFPTMNLAGEENVLIRNGRIIVKKCTRNEFGITAFSGAVTADEMSVQKIALDDLAAAFQSDGDQLRIEGISAKCYGGDGSASISFTGLQDSTVPPRYTGSANLTDADLAGITKARMKEPLEGILTTSSTFSGKLAEQSEFHANGQMTIRNGKIGELPGLFAVISLFRFHGLDAPAFHSVQLVYEWTDEQMRCHELNLLGDTFSLYGTGTVEKNGHIDFRFRPELGTRQEIPGITRLIDMIKDRTIPITVKGSQEEPVWKMNPILTITQTVRTLTQDMIGLWKSPEPQPPHPEAP